MSKCRKCGGYAPVALIGDEKLCGTCVRENQLRAKEYVGPERRFRGRNLTGVWRRWDDRPRLGLD